MSIETAWSEGCQATIGLDQLGIRGNSYRMYDHLLPGITNVTNRARYYSMHAWFIRWWAENIATNDKKAFNKKLRLFECIVGMAERIRGRDEGEDLLAIVGSDTFRGWVNDQKELKAGTSVPLLELEDRYWKHKGGGFGQYYNGSAQALGIVPEGEDLVGLTPEFGVPLAEAFGETISGTDLDKMLKEERATVGQLRKLIAAAPFDEIRGREGTLLRQVLLDDKNIFREKGKRRRNSLLTVLALARETPDGIEENPLWQVLDAALHGRTLGKTEFKIPKPLEEHFSLWRSYALQEYFASGFETLLAVAVVTA